MFSWHSWPTLERDPWMQLMAACRRLKFSRARNHSSPELYIRSCFLASGDAKCFIRKVVVSGLAHPEVLNTSGLKKALSTSRIHSSYLICLAHSCRRNRTRKDFCSMGILD